MRAHKLTTLVIGLGLVTALAACGSDDDTTSDTTSDTASDTTSPTADSTTAPAPATTADAAAGDATRTVEGADGPVEIPADPQRIVGDLMALDYMTALGFDPSNFVGVFGAGSFNDDHYLAEMLAQPELVDPGYTWEANLEALAAADPDLIVAPFDQIDGAPGLDEMRQIAPVLIVPTSATRDAGVRYGGAASFQDWRGTLRAFGAAFDRGDEAEAYIAETEAQLADLQQEYAELIADTSVTEMKSTPDFVAINALDHALESGVLGTILLSELGFHSPEQQAAATVDEYGSIDISQENVDLLDGDLLFVEVREDVRVYEDSPLWETLDVVQQGNVVEVGNHWEYGGAQAARVVIDDIRGALEQLQASA